MPIKDDDKRREYFRNKMRERRAAAKGQTTPKTPLGEVKTPPGEVAGLHALFGVMVAEGVSQELAADITKAGLSDSDIRDMSKWLVDLADIIKPPSPPKPARKPAKRRAAR